MSERGSYRCPGCGRVSSEELCPSCGVLGEAVAGVAAFRPRAAVSPPLQASPRPAPKPPPPRADPLTTAVFKTRQHGISAAGQRQLEEYVGDGYEVYLIAGIPGSGKTELLAAYRKDPYLSTFTRREGMVAATNPGTLDCHPVSLGRRKIVFTDTAGEHFSSLYPQLSPTGEIGETEIDFLRLISRRLAGVVLLLDLEKLWGPSRRVSPEHERQVEILIWILVLLRWIRRGGKSRPQHIRFQDHVNREVMRMRRRLEVPILVLFSRADVLAEVSLPSSTPSWARRSGAVERRLYPAGESPLLLAYHHLPALFEALVTHGEHFRFDFAHSLVTEHETVIDEHACGVSLSLEWLLDASWRWPSLATRRWLALQRLVDRVLGRGERWQRLPEPEDV